MNAEISDRLLVFLDELAGGPDSLLVRIAEDMAEIGWESDRLQEALAEARSLRKEVGS